jgi:hypothetical protein
VGGGGRRDGRDGRTHRRMRGGSESGGGTDARTIAPTFIPLSDQNGEALEIYRKSPRVLGRVRGKPSGAPDLARSKVMANRFGPWGQEGGGKHGADTRTGISTPLHRSFIVEGREKTGVQSLWPEGTGPVPTVVLYTYSCTVQTISRQKREDRLGGAGRVALSECFQGFLQSDS